jgi:CRISPR-associated protein Csb1
MSKTQEIDAFLGLEGPAALVQRDELVPVQGLDSPFFPPTFAAGDRFEGGYNIDTHADGTNVCLVDSVGSQANRIEPLFRNEPYEKLVPQIEVKAGERTVSILEAGHRAGDAIVRCSELQEELAEAFKALMKGNAVPLAKLAPTSLVFGVWDSRGTQAKAPRVLSSTIRAYDVQRLTRSAQYVPAAEYVNAGLLDEATDNAAKKAYAERGFIHVPASASHGGVIAKGGIRRDGTLSLSALRLLRAGTDEAQTLLLRRYVLGLALTAFTSNVSGYLRQGCDLVLDASKAQPRRLEAVYPSGARVPMEIGHADALSYATSAASAFGVGKSRTVDFDRERAKKDVAGDGEKKKSKPAKGK